MAVALLVLLLVVKTGVAGGAAAVMAEIDTYFVPGSWKEGRATNKKTGFREKKKKDRCDNDSFTME
jgi:hypothetical protein